MIISLKAVLKVSISDGEKMQRIPLASVVVVEALDADTISPDFTLILYFLRVSPRMAGTLHFERSRNATVLALYPELFWGLHS